MIVILTTVTLYRDTRLWSRAATTNAYNQQQQQQQQQQDLPIFHIVISAIRSGPTDGDDTNAISTLNQRCIESIFYFHPTARLHIHTNAQVGLQTGIGHPKLAPLVARGYDIQVKPYQPDAVLQSAMRAPHSEIDLALATVFLDNMPRLKKEKYWYANEANLLRLCVLYLEGGIYLDTDVVLINDKLAASREIDNAMGRHADGSKYHNAVMKFTPPGNKFLAATLNNMMTHYNGTKWGNNGPKAFGRTAKDHPELICEPMHENIQDGDSTTSSSSSSSRSRQRQTQPDPSNTTCWLNPLPNEAFAPVSYKKWHEVCGFPDGRDNAHGDATTHTNTQTLTYEDTKHLIANSYAVHFNNKVTGGAIGRHAYQKGSLCDVILSRYCILCTD